MSHAATTTASRTQLRPRSRRSSVLLVTVLLVTATTLLVTLHGTEQTIPMRGDGQQMILSDHDTSDITPIVLKDSALSSSFNKGHRLSPADRTHIVSRASNGEESVNGVILFLVGGRWDSYFHRECLPRLERYFLQCNPYPVHMFHENMARTQRDAIRSLIPSATSTAFEDVSEFWKRLPQGVTEPLLNEWMSDGVQRKFQGRGYRIMCRFWAGLVWRLPSMQGYDFYWRLDTDSILTGPPKVDPFLVMQRRSCHYGFNRLKGENPHVATNLWETFVAWAGTVTGDLHNAPAVGATTRPSWFPAVESFAVDKTTHAYWAPMYYNNFELGTMRLKRHTLYQSWFDYVDARPPYGIFRYRWGDAPLHTLGVMAVIAAEGWAMCNFTKEDVGYRHAALKPGPIANQSCVKAA